MNLDSYVAVSGEGALFKLVVSRNNGLVLNNLDTGKSKFYSLRKNDFTPLGTVAIYTLEDTIPLTEIFERISNQAAKNPIVDPKGDKYEIEEYFESIVPEYDEDRVYLKDMKKVIKWYNFLTAKGLLNSDEEE